MIKVKNMEFENGTGLIRIDLEDETVFFTTYQEYEKLTSHQHGDKEIQITDLIRAGLTYQAIFSTPESTDDTCKLLGFEILNDKKEIIAKKKLDKLLRTKVEILDSETGKQTSVTIVDEITGGCDLYIDLVDNKLTLCDFQDEDEQTFLGDTVEECLYELSQYDDYFNNHHDGWESNFLYELVSKK